MSEFYNIKITINKELSAIRLDKVLTKKIDKFSRSQIKILIQNGNVKKNNKIFNDSSYLVKEGDSFDINIIESKTSKYKPENIKLDIRRTEDIPLEGIEGIIHLANIANDPAVELNPTLSWEVNVLAGQQLIDKAVRAGIKQFIFASSGSVYGIKEEQHVTEDLALVPISVYNKTKMVAERVFLSISFPVKSIITQLQSCSD